jgi:hypothetical protein
MFGTMDMIDSIPDLSQVEFYEPAKVKYLEAPAELKQLQKLMGDDLWGLLADNDCLIAGGACTSVFTNKPVNDIDVYFRSKEAYQNVMLEVYGVNSDYSIPMREALVCHCTNRSTLLQSDDQDVQFIAYKFFPGHGDIFNSYDFTINMCALNMKDEAFRMHPNFIKHNAKRYLQFNPATDYPLISAMRVDKYRERGYTISKSQMLRILLAVNKKNIDSWEKLIDEVGGMYGTPPEEIFDVTKPFSLDVAIEALQHIEYRDKIVATQPALSDLMKAQPKVFDAGFKKRLKALDDAKPVYYRRYQNVLDEEEEVFFG